MSRKKKPFQEWIKMWGKFFLYIFFSIAAGALTLIEAVDRFFRSGSRSRRH